VKSLGQDSGSVYAVNTVGAIFGAIAGGYFFLPYLKLQGGLIALGVGNILVGLWILLRKNPDGRRQIKLAISCALVALCSLTAILWGQDPVKKALIKGNQTLEFYEDGPVSSIAIVRNKSTGALDLFVDGDGQAGTAISSQIHLRLLGSLPALLHPAPKQVLCIAFGAGVTAGCLVQHPVEHMDVVELSRSVIRGSPLFAPFNHDPLNDPRVKLINDDGRNFLLASNKTYDVITVDPIDPDDAGVTSLYSQEFYALVRAHLNEGGITCQWMTTHYDTAEYQMLVRTFQAVFPHSSIWQADTTSVLIGMKDGPRATMADLAARFQYPPVQKSLAVIGISSLADLLSLHFAGPAETRAFVGEGPLNTDDHPLIEYRGPRYTFNGRLFTIEESIWKPLMSLRQPDLHDCVTNWSAEDQNLIRPAYQWMSWIMERRILQSESHQEAIVPRKRSKSEENTRYLAKVDERERRERKILDLTWDLLGSPLSTIQLLMLHLGKQIEASEMLAQQFPPYKDALIRAQDAWQQQNFAEARRLFQEAAGLIPGELRASLMGVACLDRQGDIGGALKEILLLAPATPGASPIRSLAQSLVESLLASMAQPSADKAALGSLLIRVTPNDADRLFNRTQAAYNPRPTEKNVADVNAWRLWFRDAAPQLAIAPGKFIWQNNAR
jgi:spermidine synthase